MKKHLILLLLAASPLVAFADDTQIKSGSQAQEWNTYDNGGKTIVYDIYSEYGDEDTSKDPVVLNAASGNSSTVPYIRWYRINTNLNKDNATSHSFSTASNADDLVSYRASTWMNSTTSDNTPSNINKVAYTEVFSCHSVYRTNQTSEIEHTNVIVPYGAEFHLIPTYYYRNNNYIEYDWKMNLEWEGWTPNLVFHYYYDHPTRWNYSRFVSRNNWASVSSNQTSCIYTATATSANTYKAHWTSEHNGNTDTDKWTINIQTSFPSESRLSDYQKIYENEFDGYFNADPANSNRSTTGFGQNSVTSQWTSEYGLWWGADDSHPLAYEYGVFKGNLRSIQAHDGPEGCAVYYGECDAPRRMFQFVVNEGFSAGDSLYISGWFRSRLNAGATKGHNISIAVYNNTNGNEIALYQSGQISTSGYEHKGVGIQVPNGCSSIRVEIRNNSLDTDLSQSQLYMDGLTVHKKTPPFSFQDGFYTLCFHNSSNYLKGVAPSGATGAIDYANGTSFWYVQYLGGQQFKLLNLQANTDTRNYLTNTTYNGTLSYPTTEGRLTTQNNEAGQFDCIYLFYDRNLQSRNSRQQWDVAAMPSLVVSLLNQHVTARINESTVSFILSGDANILSNLRTGVLDGVDDDLEVVFPNGDRPDWLQMEIINDGGTKKLQLSNRNGGNLQSCFLEFQLVHSKYRIVRDLDASKVTSPICHIALISGINVGNWGRLLLDEGELLLADAAYNNGVMTVVAADANGARTTQEWFPIAASDTTYYLINANGKFMTRNNDNVVLEDYDENNYANQAWTVAKGGVDNSDLILSTPAGDRYLRYSAGSVSMGNSEFTIPAINAAYTYTVLVEQGSTGFDLLVHGVQAIDEVHITNTSLGYDQTISVSAGDQTLAVPDAGIISGLAVGDYTFDLTASAADGDCPCNGIDTRFKLRIVPATLHWSGSGSVWHAGSSWDEGVAPLATSTAIITTGASSYPMLLDEDEYLVMAGIPFRDQNFTLTPTTGNIHFESGARMGRTDLLDYTSASFELDGLNTLTWYNLCNPLHDTYSGDYAFGRLNPTTEMRVHNVVPATGEESATVDWSMPFNNTTVPLDGKGFGLRIGSLYYPNLTEDNLDLTSRSTPSIQPVPLEFPKTWTTYLHYDESTKELSGNTERLPSGGRDLSGRFIYENADHSVPDGDVVYTVTIPSNATDNGAYVLLPNPFFGELDLDVFFEANKDLIYNQFSLINGLKQPVYVNYTSAGDGSYTSASGSLSQLAPLQAFFVQVQADKQGQSILFTKQMSVVNQATTPQLRAGRGESTVFKASVTRKGFGNTAMMILRDGSDNEFSLDKDAELLRFTGSKAPAIAFKAQQRFADIWTVGEAPEIIPLAVFPSAKDTVRIELTGIDGLAAESGHDLYFVDTKENASILLEDDSFAYTFSSNGDNELSRFFIQYAPIGTEVAETSASTNDFIHLYTQAHTAYIQSAEEIAKIQVFSLEGRLIAESKGETGNRAVISLPRLPIVLISVQTPSQTKVFKVMQ